MSKQKTEILLKMYKKFAELPLGGKKVPTPYRINKIGGKARRGFQGKSSSYTLIKLTKKLAGEQNFDLKKVSVDQIREFMMQNKLGVDCSGFVYRMLNYLLKTLGKGTMKKAGFDKVTRTNVEALTSAKFSTPIKEINEIKPGDLIKTYSSQPIPHVVVVINSDQNKIIYAHSSKGSTPQGVHLGEIEITDPKKPIQNQNWQEKYLINAFREDLGDGIRRLKILS